MWKQYLMPTKLKIALFIVLLLIPLPFPVQLACICEAGGCSCPATMSVLPFLLISLSSFSLMGSSGVLMAIPFTLVSLGVAYYFACMIALFYERHFAKKPAEKKADELSPPPLLGKKPAKKK